MQVISESKTTKLLLIAIASIGLIAIGTEEAYAVNPNLVSVEITGPTEITVIYDIAVTSVLGDYSDFNLNFGGARALTNHVGTGTTTITLTFTGGDAVPGSTGTIDIGAGVVDFATGLDPLVGAPLNDQAVANGQQVSTGSVPNGGHQAPTLGVSKDGRQLVDDGFSYNDNPVDSAYHNTPYPLVGTNVGEENVAKLKIYSHRGIDKIQHVALGFGLAKGQIFGESNVVVEWDKQLNGIELLNVIDPENALANVRVESSTGQCKEDSSSECLIIEVYHTFRKSLENNIVGVYVWDNKLSGWQNYFNDGVEVQGESLDPAAQYQGIHKGKLITITETGKNTAIDEDGNTWTFDKSWNMDYIPQAKIDDGLTWHGFDRNHVKFDTYRQLQVMFAESLLEKNCPHCIDKSFGEIDDVFSYEESDPMSRANDQLLQKNLIKEKLKAFALFHELFEEVQNNH